MKLITAKCKKIILVTASILFTVLIAEWYFIEHEFIFNSTRISLQAGYYISLLAYLISLVTVVYFLEKNCSREIHGIAVAQLAAISCFACYIVLFIVNIIKHIVETDTVFVKILFVMMETLSGAIYATAVSYMVALRIIKPKSRWNWFLPPLLVLLILLMQVLPRFFWAFIQLISHSAK